MDHSFKDRVDKIFGSLSSSSSKPWSLTDAEVERRVWNRDKGDDDDRDDDDQIPLSSSFDNLFNKNSNRRKGLQDLSDDDGQVGGGAGDESDNDGDEWDIRSSIGLDPTLDNEEEEDAYDKMAEGRENAGDRLYMKDVTDHGPYLNSHNVLPSSVHDASKDPRANHDAAKTRLEEDDTVGAKPGLSEALDESMTNMEEPCVTATAPEAGRRIKSILKRKSDAVVKPSKRVRFDSKCKNLNESSNSFQQPEASEMKEDTLIGKSTPQLNGHGVPDYIVNPSKYTRYSFDNVNEGSNTQAYLDFLEHVRKSQNVKLEQKSDDSSGELPKSVIFIPRKKGGDGEQMKQSSTQAGSGIGIAAKEVQEDETSVMQEDESCVNADSTKAKVQKPSRQYRTKLEADETAN